MKFFFCNGIVDENDLKEFQLLSPCIRVTNSVDLELLGSPVLEEGFEKCIAKKLEKISLMVDRLSNLQSHYALFLLRSCFTVPKLIYFLRTTPTWRIQNQIDEIDRSMKEALVSILNIELNEIQWAQASLPVRFGGLGVRKLNDISIPAFLASTHSVENLMSTITDIKDFKSETPFLDASSLWKLLYGDMERNE